MAHKKHTVTATPSDLKAELTLGNSKKVTLENLSHTTDVFLQIAAALPAARPVDGFSRIRPGARLKIETGDKDAKVVVWCIDGYQASISVVDQWWG